VAKGGHDGGEASERERFHAASLPQCRSGFNRFRQAGSATPYRALDNKIA
jgi:hypothetical protein